MSQKHLLAKPEGATGPSCQLCVSQDGVPCSSAALLPQTMVGGRGHDHPRLHRMGGSQVSSLQASRMGAYSSLSTCFPNEAFILLGHGHWLS